VQTFRKGGAAATFSERIFQRTTDMNFEELIATLSKGSATAVTTLESNVAMWFPWLDGGSAAIAHFRRLGLNCEDRNGLHPRCISCGGL